MNLWEMLLWVVAIYVGFSFLVFLIKIAIIYFGFVKDEDKEDDRIDV